MANGWFDAFRENGEPTYYGDNRTPVVADMTTLSLVVVASTFILAFLVIFPGIRRARWTSFISMSLSLLVGTILLICIYYPGWHVAETRIRMPYRSFSSDQVDAVIGVNVGLRSVNITLRGFSAGNLRSRMDYNERFYFTEITTIQREFMDALERGLPYPIMSVVEYLSVDKGSFIWGRLYHLAGLYTSFLLWLSFAIWLLQLAMLCLVPSFYARISIVLGGCIWMADLIYGLASPQTLVIPFPSVQGDHTLLRFRFGWCFWLTFCAGALCIVIGVTIRILEANTWFKFTTFLQMDEEEPASTAESNVSFAPTPADVKSRL